MIGIVDYGIGNVKAFLNIYDKLGIKAKRIFTVDCFAQATHLILPGVGHFDYALQKLSNSGLKQTLQDLVLDKNIPILGVCVGMQIFADSSEEGKLNGLGWIPGKVKSFENKSRGLVLPMPHMGWNKIIKKNECRLFKNFEKLAYECYFLHSFYFDTTIKSHVKAVTEYGFEFDSVISSNNIYGVQFHPEKSHELGEIILKNFSKI